MHVTRIIITSVFVAGDPLVPPLRRILRETGLEVVRPARRLPPSWQRFVKSKRFLRSRLWSRLRYDFLRDHDARCQCCGRDATDVKKLNVDHILTRKTHPQFALAYANLQLLCSTCNKGKGNRDCTDWRYAQRRGPQGQGRRPRPASQATSRSRRRRTRKGVSWVADRRGITCTNWAARARRKRYGKFHWGRWR